MRVRWRHLGVLFLGLALAPARPASARQDPVVPPEEPAGVQVLTQGPIHEAFAEPVLYDPKPGPVIPRTPPPPVNEVPPDQKPEGDNVQWIPGYWAWDDSRNDFLWVSGVWRAIPPGRQWVPGYWNPADGGAQWVPGYWGAVEDPNAAQAEYLPEPPASLERGPTSPAPSADAVWAPGNWVWQNDQYAWQPGFWVANQPGWMWTPAQYSYTPSGYLYNPGFWDYPLASRGMAFAPAYFNQGAFGRPGFQYSPAVALMTSALASSLFVRPAYHQYYFGNYYAPNNFQNGIYPWYSFHQSRYGYDPLYAYAAAQHGRTDPRWAQELHDSYVYRRDHADARPPATFAEMRRIAARPAAGTNRPAYANNLSLARPISQLASAPPAGGNAQGIRFQRVEQARRQELAKQAAQVHQFREERQRREAQAVKAAPRPAGEPPRPRRVEMPRSPIVAARAEGHRAAPPARPEHPHIDRAARPPAREAAPIRHEPGPAVRPPAHQPPPPRQPQPDGTPRPGGPDRKKK